MQLPEGWECLEADRSTIFVAEVARELSPAHDLFGIDLIALAKRLENDDVLFQTKDSTGKLFLVHLTWQVEKCENFPIYREVTSIDEL